MTLLDKAMHHAQRNYAEYSDEFLAQCTLDMLLEEHHAAMLPMNQCVEVAEETGTLLLQELMAYRYSNLDFEFDYIKLN